MQIPAKSFQSAQYHLSSTTASHNRDIGTKAHNKAKADAVSAHNFNMSGANESSQNNNKRNSKSKMSSKLIGSMPPSAFESHFAHHLRGISLKERSGIRESRPNSRRTVLREKDKGRDRRETQECEDRDRERKYTALQHIDDILEGIQTDSKGGCRDSEGGSATSAEIGRNRGYSSSKRNSSNTAPQYGNKQSTRTYGGDADRGRNLEGIDFSNSLRNREGQRRGTHTVSGISNLVEMVDEIVSKLT